MFVILYPSDEMGAGHIALSVLLGYRHGLLCQIGINLNSDVENHVCVLGFCAQCLCCNIEEIIIALHPHPSFDLDEFCFCCDSVLAKIFFTQE